MKKFLLTLLLVALVSCSSDDDGNDCITCKVSGISLGEACKGENGNAFIDGEDMNVPFEDYAAAMEESFEGATCN